MLLKFNHYNDTISVNKLCYLLFCMMVTEIAKPCILIQTNFSFTHIIGAKTLGNQDGGCVPTSRKMVFVIQHMNCLIAGIPLLYAMNTLQFSVWQRPADFKPNTSFLIKLSSYLFFHTVFLEKSPFSSMKGRLLKVFSKHSGLYWFQIVVLYKIIMLP